jgi:hypothetical protein
MRDSLNFRISKFIKGRRDRPARELIGAFDHELLTDLARMIIFRSRTA